MLERHRLLQEHSVIKEGSLRLGASAANVTVCPFILPTVR